MKQILNRAFFILFVTGLFRPAFGQVLDPVKWTSTIEQQTATEVDIRFVAVIEEGWAMYAVNIPEGPARPVPTSFVFEPNVAFELIGSIVEVTPPDVKFDVNFDMNVGQFKKMAVFRQKIKPASAETFAIKGFVEYMCCNDNSCLPPNQVDFLLHVAPSNEAHISAHISAPPTGDEPEAANSLWGFFLIALSAGLLGVLTPCVYPMIPLTVSFFMRGEKNRKNIIKALVFGLSIIFIYMSLGVVVALTKSADITNLIVGHWLTNLIFAVIFIAFALSFFGLYEIALPGSLSNSIDRKADKGGYISAFFMALALVVISFSCTGPFVGSILVASAKGLAIKPVLGMFGFGLTFALPFTVLAFFPSLTKKLPKSGAWLNSVKVVFAFVMLAFAVYFLSFTDKALGWNILTRNVFLCIWFVIAVLMGLYLLGIIRFAHDSKLKHAGIPRWLLAVISFAFAGYLLTGLSGKPLRVLSSLLPAAKQGVAVYDQLCGIPKYSDHSNLSWPLTLQGYFDYDEAIACAKEQNKPVLMIFKGHGCAKCREMEANIWPDAEVLRLLQHKFVLLALYTDDASPLPETEYIISAFDGKVKKTLGQKNTDLQIARYQTNAFPYYAILNADGETIGQPMGYTKDAMEFKAFLQEEN
jgi:thiol:disulfide interchange protein DsbD